MRVRRRLQNLPKVIYCESEPWWKGCLTLGVLIFQNAKHRFDQTGVVERAFKRVPSGVVRRRAAKKERREAPSGTKGGNPAATMILCY